MWDPTKIFKKFDFWCLCALTFCGGKKYISHSFIKNVIITVTLHWLILGQEIHAILWLSEQCKEIEENDRIRKTRDLFKKIRATKRIFHAKMGTIKDRDSLNLTEAEEIKKRWQEFTEELSEKCLNDPDNHSSVVTHPQPDILECEVKLALGSIATNKA